MADAKSTVKEILDNRRSFVFESREGESKTYFIANPSGEDIRKADWNYSKVFNNAMADGFPTTAQMLEVLKERGIISDEYTNEVEQTRIRLAAALYRLENLSEDADDAEKEGLALETSALRDQLFRLNQKVNGPLGNTCENLAEDARTEYLTSRIIQNQDSSKVWPVYDNYLQEENTALCIKSRFEVMLWLQGLDSNFLENTPEQSALRRVAQKRLENALSEVNLQAQEKETSPIVENLQLPEVEEPEPKVVVGKKGRSRGKKGV